MSEQPIFCGKCGKRLTTESGYGFLVPQFDRHTGLRNPEQALNANCPDGHESWVNGLLGWVLQR